MSPWLVVTCCLVVVLGGLLQRIAGMGMGLVAAPILTLLLGPLVGVTMSNAVAVVAAALILISTHRDVDWQRWLQMVPLLLVGTIAGVVVLPLLPAAWLDVVVGASVLLALVAGAVLGRRTYVPGGRPLAMATGFTAGLMNTTSGVAGPALTAYGLAIRWEHRSFAATLQPIFLLANIASLVAKVVSGTVSPASLAPWWVWIWLIASVPLGVLFGRLLQPRTPVRVARAITIGIATAGATLATVRGLLTI